MEGEATVTFASIISNIGEIVTGMVGWVTDLLGVFTSNPLLFFFVLVPIVGALFGFAITMLKKFTNKKKV